MVSEINNHKNKGLIIWLNWMKEYKDSQRKARRCSDCLTGFAVVPLPQ
jgi:hypothetical protein